MHHSRDDAKGRAFVWQTEGWGTAGGGEERGSKVWRGRGANDMERGGGTQKQMRGSLELDSFLIFAGTFVFIRRNFQLPFDLYARCAIKWNKQKSETFT